MRYGGPRHVKVAVKIGFDGPVKMLVSQLFEAINMLLEGGIIDEDIEPAEFSNCCFHCTLAESRVSHIAGQQNTATTFMLYSPFGFLGILVLI